MYNINILTKCDDDCVRAAIIAAVNELLYQESNFCVRRMKHGMTSSPMWNVVSRKENLNNKF